MILQADSVMKRLPQCETRLLPDSSYWIPTSEFMSDVYTIYYELLSGEMLAEKYKGVNLLTWFQHHDCNRKSMLLKVVADAVFAEKYASEILAEAPAVFYMYYMSGKGLFSKGSGHSINMYLTEDGIEYVEPQKIVSAMSYPIVSLSSQERESIFVIGG
jgi:hypothetical protein